MCERHSFCLTRSGKVLDGCGLSDSHTTIMDMHGLKAAQHDACNLYEWQPPQGWPEASYAAGLKVDRAAFETRQRQEDAVRRHVTKLYPNREAWNAGDVIRWKDLPLPDSDRVQRAYELALQAKPLGYLCDETVLALVNRHLDVLGCKIKAVKVSDVRASVRASVRPTVWASVRASVRAGVRASVWASVRASVRASVWDSGRASVRAGVRASVWDSVRDSVDCSMVREDAENPWLPLSELATHGVYLYGVADDGTAYLLRGDAPTDEPMKPEEGGGE